jgi:hypothetical protein
VSTPRERIADASLPAVSFLSRLPRWVPFAAVLALMLAGVVIPGWGWILLLLVLLFLLWTLYLSWPALDGTGRLMRTTVIVLMAAITVTQAIPRT